MFLLSMRFGALATATGRASSWASGRSWPPPGWRFFLRIDADVDYLTDLLPGLLVFSLGLSMTVAPLTATVLADADEHNAGIASGVNNAIARGNRSPLSGASGYAPAAVRQRWPGPRRVLGTRVPGRIGVSALMVALGGMLRLVSIAARLGR